MYKTANISTKQLQTIKIENQNEIFRLTGGKLNLTVAWEMVKRLSNNFKKKVSEALKADALLYELLYPNQIDTSVKRTKVQIQNENRARAQAQMIKIIAMELEMAKITKK